MMTTTYFNWGSKMRFLSAAFIALLFVSNPVAADCYGTDSYKTCYDSESGNRYTITKYGNTTNVRGRNSRTGSTWSQKSRTIGNTTFHSGRAADGGYWSGTERRIGNTRYIRGHDSDGNPYSETIFDNEYGGSNGLDSLGSDSGSLYDGLGSDSGSLYDDSLYDGSLYDDDW